MTAPENPPIFLATACKAGHPLTTRMRGGQVVRCCRVCENAARRERKAATR